MSGFTSPSPPSSRARSALAAGARRGAASPSAAEPCRAASRSASSPSSVLLPRPSGPTNAARCPSAAAPPAAPPNWCRRADRRSRAAVHAEGVVAGAHLDRRGFAALRWAPPAARRRCAPRAPPPHHQLCGSRDLLARRHQLDRQASDTASREAVGPRGQLEAEAHPAAGGGRRHLLHRHHFLVLVAAAAGGPEEPHLERKGGLRQLPRGLPLDPLAGSEGGAATVELDRHRRHVAIPSPPSPDTRPAGKTVIATSSSMSGIGDVACSLSDQRSCCAALRRSACLGGRPAASRRRRSVPDGGARTTRRARSVLGGGVGATPIGRLLATFHQQRQPPHPSGGAEEAPRHRHRHARRRRRRELQLGPRVEQRQELPRQGQQQEHADEGEDTDEGGGAAVVAELAVAPHRPAGDADDAVPDDGEEEQTDERAHSHLAGCSHHRPVRLPPGSDAHRGAAEALRACDRPRCRSRAAVGGGAQWRVAGIGQPFGPRASAAAGDV